MLEKESENDINQSFICLFLLMEREEKVFLRKNLIKFVIGLVLLWFSFSYIQSHPAEKASIFSGFQVLRQKVVVYVHKVTNTNSEAYAKKFDYEKTYQELVSMAKTKACSDAAILTELNETYLNLKKEWLKTLDQNLPWYARKANEYKHMIENCAK